MKDKLRELAGVVVEDGSCDVYHEPLADDCACQNEYRSEHDSRSER
jgi:hypothetical protein